MIASASKFDIDAYKGVDIEVYLYWTDSNGNPIDVGSFSMFMQLREQYSNALLFDATPFVENGSSPQTGLITIKIPATETKNFNFTHAVFDILAKSVTENVYIVATGRMSVKNTITVI